MRTIITIYKPIMPPTHYFPRRPRSTNRRPRRCYRMWENGFVKEGGVVEGSEKGKGKRKCKGVNENDDKLEGVNAISVNEEEVDLNLIARVGDGAYGNELESLTKGMSRVQLLGFMDSLDGHWCGRSERRKVVNADEIVKVLPIGWKVEIAVRRRGELSSLYCRNYVSPTGMQFKSCKDAAIYLRDQSLMDVAGPFQVREMRQINEGSRMLFKSINEVTCSSAINEANNNLLPGINNLYDVKIATRIDCFPCGLAFDDMDGLKKHLVIFHKKTTREFHLPEQPHTVDKARTDNGQCAIVGHDEPQLGETSTTSSQKIPEVEEPVAIVNENNKSSSFRTECTWCSKVFLCEPVDAETMADATGFMCLKCKEKLCGALERSLSRAY